MCFQTGHVFVFTGILNFAQNDDQLAVIVAHEMAHALLNHGVCTDFIHKLFLS